MVVHLIAVGKVKNAALRDACEGYSQRVRHYLKLDVREVRDGGRADRDAESARKLEGEALLRAVPNGAVIVAVTRAGRATSSRELAGQLEQWRQEGRDVAFLVGGAHGLAATVLERAQRRLSLSSMTFPHEVARLILLEQLYRACTISRGEPYHKGADR
ncbi:MAG: 23S rRNA (pseudouridine(1915)-N(3))-methyltransferase RlmH [Gemmatimonadota bacterium]|nr:MAG: 23S rRNA (pseudouridine(1915)-N(3))-methyltransferase RlmH [Gemmatimonadota bacterium]